MEIYFLSDGHDSTVAISGSRLGRGWAAGHYWWYGYKVFQTGKTNAIWSSTYAGDECILKMAVAF